MRRPLCHVRFLLAVPTTLFLLLSIGATAANVRGDEIDEAFLESPRAAVHQPPVCRILPVLQEESAGVAKAPREIRLVQFDGPEGPSYEGVDGPEGPPDARSDPPERTIDDGSDQPEGESYGNVVDVDTMFGPECCYDFQGDLRGYLPTLRDDARAIVNWNNAAILGGALATSIAFRQDLDDDVRRNTARHPERWGDGSKTLGHIGEAQYHVAAMAILYGVSLHRCDDELHEFTTTLISAYTINGLSTLAMKGIANTDRPSDDWNGGAFGFPSFHASGTFTMAAVIDEYYGARAGLPAYALAGLISWSRIDERDHDLSDVVFGAAMGYVIGHAVAGQHLRCDSRVRLLPWVHPTEGTSGLMVDVAY